MDYIVYCTENLVNGRYYIGYHETEDASVFDGYLGSGKIIKQAIKMHGRENFERKTLAVCESSDLALEMEELVVSYCLEDPNCYNVCDGGKSLGTWCKKTGSGIFALTPEQLAENGRKGAKRIVDDALGIHGWSLEKRQQHGRDASEKRFSEWNAKEIANHFGEIGKLGGRKCVDEKLGFHAMSRDDMSARSKATIARVSLADQQKQAITMGAGNKGSIIYNDGVRYFRYTKKKQEIMGFDDFLKANPEFSRGKP